jgi:hypothetical protein
MNTETAVSESGRSAELVIGHGHARLGNYRSPIVSIADYLDDAPGTVGDERRHRFLEQLPFLRGCREFHSS